MKNLWIFKKHKCEICGKVLKIIINSQEPFQNFWQIFWKIIITQLSWLKGKLNNDKEKLCPFLPKSYFFYFSSLLLLPCQKTLVFRFFSINSQVIWKNSRPLASNFSILLSNLLKKISIQEFYDTETTTARRKQKNKTLVDRTQ